MFTVILGGVIVIIVSGWGYYSSMHYIYLSNTPLMDVHVLKYILDNHVFCNNLYSKSFTVSDLV